MVPFTKDNMDADKPFPVVNLPTVRFMGAPTRQGRTGSIQGPWDPILSISVHIYIVTGW